MGPAPTKFARSQPPAAPTSPLHVELLAFESVDKANSLHDTGHTQLCKSVADISHFFKPLSYPNELLYSFGLLTVIRGCLATS